MELGDMKACCEKRSEENDIVHYEQVFCIKFVFDIVFLAQADSLKTSDEQQVCSTASGGRVRQECRNS